MRGAVYLCRCCLFGGSGVRVVRCRRFVSSHFVLVRLSCVYVDLIVCIVCGQMNGEGQCRWDHTGVVYIGQWMDNKRHGFGKQTSPDGTLYEVHSVFILMLALP